jgi:hypothetical protein
VVRAANIQEAAPATPEPVTFTWVPGDYSACSALCGGGWQARLTGIYSPGWDARPVHARVPVACLRSPNWPPSLGGARRGGVLFLGGQAELPCCAE